MSINSVTNTPTISTAYSNSAKHYQQNESGNVNKISSSDQLTLTAEGKQIAAMQGAGLIHELKPISLDPKVHLEEARVRISEILKEMGVSEYTPIEISRDSSGKIEFVVDHLDGDEIAKALEEDKQLTSSIGGAHGAMALQRIAKAASGLFDDIPEGNINARNQAIDWIQNFARETSSYSMTVSYNGAMSGGTLANAKGVAVDYMNNFTVPKFV